MTNITLTKSRHLLPFASVLRQHGIDTRCLLRNAGLPPGCMNDPETLVPAVCLGRFRELAAHKTGCSDITLKVGAHLEIQNLGSLGREMLQEPTLFGALTKFRNLVATETSNVVIRLRPQSNGDLWLSHRILSPAGPDGWQSKLYVIICMLKCVRLVDSVWSPSEILINAKATQERFETIEVLGSTARFQENDTGFLVPASMLALPVTKYLGPGEDTDADFQSTAPARTYAESVKQVLRSYTTVDWLSIEQLGELTDTSIRTIQRRLSAEQKTYSGLIQQCRAEMAGDLLTNTDATMAEIAHQLGYNKQGNFTRAFYRWAKVSPSEFRKQRSLTH